MGFALLSRYMGSNGFHDRSGKLREEQGMGWCEV